MSEELAAQLTALCRARTGDPEASAEGVAALPGHAGFSFRFTLHARGASEPLVLRLAPPGVRIYGTADVARQARLIQVLAQRGIPVPPVRWYGDEPNWFGRPYSVVELLPGATVAQLDEGGALSAGLCAAVVEQAVDVLARLHALEPVAPARWLEEPLEPVRDVERWDRFVERSADPELVALAPALRRRLIERAPRRFRIGMFHGDFQWSNLLVHADALVAVLDWELAAVGPVLNDLGWLCLFSDPESWGEDHPALPPAPPPEEVEQAYRHAWGEALDGDVAWFRALAGYKFAAISGFNLMLHRRGKRPDPYWERLESSIPRLLARGLKVLDESERRAIVGYHKQPAGEGCRPASSGSTPRGKLEPTEETIERERG
jgi:aminoglycoside phosphotransferase (APT) family kinase protein